MANCLNELDCDILRDTNETNLTKERLLNISITVLGISLIYILIVMLYMF